MSVTDWELREQRLPSAIERGIRRLYETNEIEFVVGTFGLRFKTLMKVCSSESWVVLGFEKKKKNEFSTKVLNFAVVSLLRKDSSVAHEQN